MFDANFEELSCFEKMSTNSPKAHYFKPFSGETGTMAALFTSDHGWIENLPVDQVFSGDLPSGIAFEEMHPIADFPADQFNQSFISARTDYATETPVAEVPATVTFRTMIYKTAAEMKLPPVQMCDFTRELFKQMRIQLSTGNSLDSSFASVSPEEVTPKGWVFQFK